MRIRKTATAGVVLFALLGLAACRSEPQNAAYVGDFTLTEARVTQLVDDANAAEEARFKTDVQRAEDAQKAGQQAPQPVRPVKFTREEAVTYVVADQICERLRAEKNFSFTPSQTQLAPSDLLTIISRADGCISALPAEAADPSEKDIRGLYDRGVQAGVISPDTTYAEARDALTRGDALRNATGKRNLIEQAAKAADVSINPRYQPLNLALLQWPNTGQFAFGPLLGNDPDAVINTAK